MKIIKNSRFVKNIRNFLGYKPTLEIINSNVKNLSTSDAFFWRTDNQFKTIFKYTDIFKLFLMTQLKKLKLFFTIKLKNF